MAPTKEVFVSFLLQEPLKKGVSLSLKPFATEMLYNKGM